MAENIQPGDLAILDDATVPGSSYIFKGGRSFSLVWRRSVPPMRLSGGLAPATLLDIDPGEAFQRSASRVSILHIYVPARNH